MTTFLTSLSIVLWLVAIGMWIRAIGAWNQLVRNTREMRED